MFTLPLASKPAEEGNHASCHNREPVKFGVPMTSKRPSTTLLGDVTLSRIHLALLESFWVRFHALGAKLLTRLAVLPTEGAAQPVMVKVELKSDSRALAGAPL